MSAQKCSICGTEGLKTHYRGPIRMGKFGNLSAEPHTVMECPSCEARALPNTFGASEEYYQSETYRKEVDGAAEAADYFRMHDYEQAHNLSVTGTALFRDKVVADIGCGAGSFLDGVKGYAASAIAVEPYAAFRASLAARGYRAYAYTADALREHRGKVDVATSFSVLEHVDDPRGFLSEIRELLAPGGKAIISTPNADDVLLEALPEDYSRFFFRKAHLWYFHARSFQKLLALAGFRTSVIRPHQRFGLGNFHGWIRDRRPQGEIRPDYLGAATDAAWKADLERTFRCDYLYAEAYA